MANNSKNSKNSKSKTQRKVERTVKKQVKKTAKKHPVLFVIVVIIIIAILAGCYYAYSKGYLDSFLPKRSEHDSHKGGNVNTYEYSVEEISSSEMSIHFLELGNKYSGDCTLIKCGDTELLIDAGSKKDSAKTLKTYIDQYCTDGKLEYVIATHAHEDHIAGFVGSQSGATRTGLFYQYEIGTLIQFAKAGTTSKLYTEEYKSAVEYIVSKGTEVYTALECWNGENGAKREYTLNSEGTVKFSILYQKYYETNSSKENNYSVCTLLSDSQDNYLFTGDLEEVGEKSLAESNTLPHCKLFKAGHHGSTTSSNDCLLSKITPEIVCVCCCGGWLEYADTMENAFPTQNFCDKVGKYTDQIYVTSMANEDGTSFGSMNGNIAIIRKDGEIVVCCSNNDTIFRKTDWFKAHRTWNGVTSDGE